jgi:wyosine [tRNA(Phe)-imidazoG37] synthetase (radical SAM superfamily)
MVKRTKVVNKITEIVEPAVPEPVPVTEIVVPPTKKPRKPRKKKEETARKPSAYAQFVKEQYPSVKDKPNKDRFKIIAQRWKDQKAK